jgi:hypothetical protein
VYCLTSDLPTGKLFYISFFDCAYTGQLHERFLSTFFPDLALNTANERICFLFLGTLPHTGKNNFMFVRVFAVTWLFVIWEAKLLRQPLTPHMAFKNLLFFIRNMLATSGRLRYEKTICNLFLCRSWDEIHRRHG